MAGRSRGRDAGVMRQHHGWRLDSVVTEGGSETRNTGGGVDEGRKNHAYVGLCGFRRSSSVPGAEQSVIWAGLLCASMVVVAVAADAPVGTMATRPVLQARGRWVSGPCDARMCFAGVPLRAPFVHNAQCKGHVTALPRGGREAATGRFRRLQVVAQVGLKNARQNVDYFAVLGISRGASLQDIKAAYKVMALKNHPDVSKEPDASAKFALIYEAYTTLSENEVARQEAQRIASMPRGPVRNTKHYRLGEVVVHKRDNYIGVVVGVDEVCGASDDWAQAQNIDQLSRGRNQRFYHLLPDLPETEDGKMSLGDAAEVLCECPAFLTMLTDEDEWPTLQTSYVPEDLLVRFMHTGHEGVGGPVHNPLVKKYFMKYSRGRYAHDGVSLEAMKFFPVAEAVTFCLLYGSNAINENSNDQ